MAASDAPPLGTSVRRKEDPRLLAGRGRYVADVRLPGALHAAILRSPYGHARISNIDLGPARALDGVVAALSARELGDRLRPIPMRLTPIATLAAALQLPLATDRVRYAGEPVAVVVAVSRYISEDALEQIQVEYEPLPAVVDVADALRTNASVLHEAVGSNCVAELTTRTGDVEAAFEAADLIVEQSFAIQRHGAVPLETRGLTAHWDEQAQRLTVWGPTKVPHFNRGVLASLLDLEEHAIRFVEPDVGGGFGARGEFYPEDFLIPLLARQLERPVTWIEDRFEHLRSTNHSRQQQHRARLALSADGLILGLWDEIDCDMGAYVRTHGATVPSLTAAMLPGPYRIPAYLCRVRCVLTNKTPTGTYRAPGRFEANFVRERLVDLAAQRLGLTPEELRRRNLVRAEEMPYDQRTTALSTPTVYDSGDYPRMLAETLEVFDLAAARADQAAARREGRLVGVGLGFFVEKSGTGPWEYGRLELEADGSLTLYSGCASLGQGIETALAQICAHVLQVSVDDVRVVHGDTARVPRGGGAFASRGTVMAGSAAHQAATELARRLLERGATLIETSVDDLVLHNGHVEVRGSPQRGVSYAELARRYGSTGAGGPWSIEAVFESSHMAYPYGLHAATVEVDRDTGRLYVLRYVVAYDVGRAVNPMLVDGQLVGGVAQGIGGALLENFSYDRTGQLTASTFMDYLVPTATDVPTVEVLLSEHAPSPLNPLGLKGAGEGGTAGAAAVLANAVADALAPLGIAIDELPLSPERLQSLIRAAHSVQ